MNYFVDEYEIELQDGKCVYPNVKCSGRVQNDGIGSYEYWGFKGYDKGVDYFEVDDITWNESDFTPEQNAEIKKYFDYDNGIEQFTEYLESKIGE